MVVRSSAAAKGSATASRLPIHNPRTGTSPDRSRPRAAKEKRVSARCLRLAKQSFKFVNGETRGANETSEGASRDFLVVGHGEGWPCSPLSP